MENYRMNYRNPSCHRGCPGDCARVQPCMPEKTAVCLENLPVAMAYVPTQKFCDTFDTRKGLQMGTIFPELCKPFCGKGGGCH